MDLKAYAEQLPRGGKKILAIKLGLSASYLARLISGDRSITAERALQIEDATQGLVSRFDLRPDLAWSQIKSGSRASVVRKIPRERVSGQTVCTSVQASSAQAAAT